MQSGNDRILKMMNRRYDVQKYTEIVRKIQNEIENVTVTSDFIAGFPSETEEEFQDFHLKQKKNFKIQLNKLNY